MSDNLERPTKPIHGGARPASAIGPGRVIDGFRIDSILGEGGMGVVYRARDLDLERDVALKLVRTDAAGALQSQQRLLREAQAMARVDHPNVITVYRVGTVDGSVYIAMELVDGHTLAEWIQAAPRTIAEILEVFARSGRGLQAAHSAGLVHRDFKPGNVLVGADGRVRVVDFGLVGVSASDPEAAPSSSSEPLTATGALLGTPRYMSPEQLDAGSIEARSDVYAFCVALYECLYGIHPVAHENFAELASRTIEGEQRATPSSPAVPRSLRRAIEAGLITDPAKRLDSMAPILAALSRRKTVSVAASAIAALGIGAAILIGVAVLPDSDDKQSAIALADSVDADALFRRGARALREDRTNEALADLASAYEAGLARRSDELHLRVALSDALRRIEPVPAFGRKTVDAASAQLELSADGDVLSLMGESGIVRRFSTSDGSELAGFTPDTAPASRWVSADGTHLLVSAGTRFQIRDIATGIARWTVDEAVAAAWLVRSANRGIAALADGRVVIASLDGNGDGVASVPSAGPLISAALSSDGGALVTLGAGESRDTLRVLDTSTGKPLATMDINQPFASVSTDVTGQRIALKGTPQTWIVDRARTGAVRISDPDPDSAAILSSDGERVFLVRRSEVRVHRTSDGALDMVLPASGPTRIVPTADGGDLIATLSSDALVLHDGASGRRVARFEPRDRITDFAVSRTEQVAATVSANGTLLLWPIPDDVATEIAAPKADTFVRAVFAADGSRIVTEGSKSVRLWTSEGDALAHFEEPPGTPAQMSSDALGQRVLTGNSVWSSSTGDRIAQLLPAIDRAFPSTLDSRGELAATANFRGQLVVWSATSGRVLHELSSGGAPITSMAFADGDGVLAVADAERRIRLFGVTDGTTLASFESPRVAHALRFSSDGRALIALAPPHLIEFGRDGSELSRHETTAVRLSASSGSAIVAAHSPRAVAGSNRVLEVIGDTSSSSKLVRVLRAMRGVSFSPRQDALLAVDTDGVATLWELTTLDPLLTRHAGGRPSYVELGARNRLLVTTPHQIYLEVLREETRPAEIVTRLADRAR